MPALSEIGAFARRHDPDRFLCALFAPADRREAIFALIGFNHELARAREAARTPLAALVRWQWWREVVEGAERRHEVATPLSEALAAGALDRGDLLAMVDAREVEAEESMPDRAAFDAYLAGTAGGWAVAAARCLGAPHALLPAVREAGAAYGLAGVLRSAPALARQGRSVLPAGTDIATLARSALPVRRRWPAVAIPAVLPLAFARSDLARLRCGSAPKRGDRGFTDRLGATIAAVARYV